MIRVEGGGGHNPLMSRSIPFPTRSSESKNGLSFTPAWIASSSKASQVSHPMELPLHSLPASHRSQVSSSLIFTNHSIFSPYQDSATTNGGDVQLSGPESDEEWQGGRRTFRHDEGSPNMSSPLAGGADQDFAGGLSEQIADGTWSIRFMMLTYP